MIKTSAILASTAFMVLITSLPVADAAAAAIRVKCEKSTNPARSSISVDGRNLAPGSYSAVVISGDNRAKAPLTPAIGDEVKFDFDSNPNDIAAGAVKISRNFIQGGKVTGKIKDDQGFVVIQSTSICTVR